MHSKKLQDLKKRIESILFGQKNMSEYASQVTAEAIIQLLLEEDILKAGVISSKKRSDSK